MRIDDEPDFEHRGVMLDISRDKVPTLQTTMELVDQLASWKINQVMRIHLRKIVTIVCGAHFCVSWT